MQMPKIRISFTKPDIGKDEIDAVVETMRSGWVTQSKKVEEFEQAFAKYCGVKYGVAVSNGTAALHIALAVACEYEIVMSLFSHNLGTYT